MQIAKLFKLLFPVILIFISFPVFADEESSEELHAWSIGVDEKEMEIASKIYAQGNAKLKDALFPRAIMFYREALTHWNHPSIHFNYAMALFYLDQPIEMHRELVEATKYGPDAINYHKEKALDPDAETFEESRFTTAMRHKTNLEKRLVRIKLRCEEPDANVEIDGRKVFTGPATMEALIMPGVHIITATKKGLRTNEFRREMKGGDNLAFNMDLQSDKQLTRYTHRWNSSWKPYAVMGSGVVLGLTGVLLQTVGKQQARDAKNDYENRCSGGCDPTPSDITRKRTTAKVMRTAGITAYGLGAGAIITGGILAYMNRAHPYIAPYQVDVQPIDPANKSAIDIGPLIDANNRGILATVRF